MSIYRQVVLHVKIVFYTFIYFIVFVAAFILLLPVYGLRGLAYLVSRFLRPDLDNLVHSRSAVLSCDDYSKDPRWNVVIWITLEGNLDFDGFCKSFMKIVEKKESNGKLKFPEFQQHYENFWGFQFWRWEKKFDIKEHMREYDGKHKGCVIDDKLLIDVIKELTWKPWAKDKSPWEFLYVPQYEMKNDPTPNSPKFLLIFRVHHGLTDGYGLVNLFMNEIGGDMSNEKSSLEDRLGIPKPPKISCLRSVITKALIWFLGPYDCVRMMVTSFDVNDWRFSEEEMVKPMNAALSEEIKLSLIKEIKNAHGVCFSSVITAALAGTIRKTMHRQGLSVPEKVHTGVPIPIPGHPGKLRNHFICNFLALPTGAADPIARLRKSDKYISRLKRSSASILNFMIVPLVGSTFPWMINFFFKNRLSTCIMSNMPGMKIDLSGYGARAFDVMFTAGVGPGKVGLGFTFVSHKDHIRMLCTADRNILKTDQDVAEFNTNFIQELKLLQNVAPFPTRTQPV